MWLPGLLALLSAVTIVRCDFGLINILYWKADANLDLIISKDELKTIWHDFDKNDDKNVTQAEYLPLWMDVTGQSREVAIAYFLLADMNDNEVIDQSDINTLYKYFDQDNNGQVSAEEFSSHWQKIILDMPFAVMFEHADTNHDEVLTIAEYTNGFLLLDGNHNGELTEGEFVSQWMHHGFGAGYQAEAFFKYLDTNKDHVISASELSVQFVKFDTTGSHRLTLMQFIKLSAFVPQRHSRQVARSSEIQYEVYLFDAVDVDNSTFLDRSELQRLFFIFDNNNDSRVTSDEFVNTWAVALKLGSVEQAKNLFARAESTGDNVLTSADLVYIFRSFDANRDQKVSVDEFLTKWGSLKLGASVIG